MASTVPPTDLASWMRWIERRMTSEERREQVQGFGGGGGSIPGDQGPEGPPGRGVTSVTINSSGHLIITYTDATTVDAGAVQGPKGDPGSPGQQGPAGRSIQSATVNGLGHLVLTYSDATTADVGVVIGPPGADGPKGDKGDKGDPGQGSAPLTWVPLPLTNGWTAFGAGYIPPTYCFDPILGMIHFAGLLRFPTTYNRLITTALPTELRPTKYLLLPVQINDTGGTTRINYDGNGILSLSSATQPASAAWINLEGIAARLL